MYSTVYATERETACFRWWRWRRRLCDVVKIENLSKTSGKRTDRTTTINILMCVYYILLLLLLLLLLLRLLRHSQPPHIEMLTNFIMFGVCFRSGSIVHVQVWSWKVRDSRARARKCIQIWESRISLSLQNDLAGYWPTKWFRCVRLRVENESQHRARTWNEMYFQTSEQSPLLLLLLFFQMRFANLTHFWTNAIIEFAFIRYFRVLLRLSWETRTELGESK